MALTIAPSRMAQTRENMARKMLSGSQSLIPGHSLSRDVVLRDVRRVPRSFGEEGRFEG